MRQATLQLLAAFPDTVLEGLGPSLGSEQLPNGTIILHMLYGTRCHACLPFLEALCYCRM